MKYNIATGVERSKHRIKKLTIGIAASTLMAGAAAFPAIAAGNDHSGATTGDCISDGFYGNEPNTASGAPGGPAEQDPGSQAGNTLPSQSPGPFVTNPITGEVTKGNSIAYYNGTYGPGAVPKACQAYAGH